MTDNLSIAGTWTYRSFRNTTEFVEGEATRALALIFGEGVFTFEVPAGVNVRGTFELGGGFALDVTGTVQAGTPDAPLTVHLIGAGREATPTAGWEYDYHGFVAFQWPNAVNQTPALVGSVIRAKPHNGAPAGFVASFIAVKQQ